MLLRFCASFLNLSFERDHFVFSVSYASRREFNYYTYG